MTPTDAFARYRERSREAVRQNLHHDQRRAHLQDLLRDGFGIEASEVELERNVQVAEARGRIDLLFRNLVFEVKRDLEREHDDVLRELRLYLTENRERAFAIATDGTRFEAYRLVDDEARVTNELDFEEASNEDAVAWLDAFLFTQEAVTPNDIVRQSRLRRVSEVGLGLAPHASLSGDHTSMRGRGSSSPETAAFHAKQRFPCPSFGVPRHV